MNKNYLANKQILYIIILLVLFSSLTILKSNFMQFNEFIRNVVWDYRPENLYYLMYGLHFFYEPLIGVIQCLIISATLFFVFKDKVYAIIFAVSLLAQTLICTILKFLISSPRPPQEYIGVLAHNNSYPSSHTAASLSIAMFVLNFALFRCEKKVLKIVAFVYLILAILTAYSRIYVDVHWCTDILAGWLISLLVVSTAMLVMKKFTRASVEAF